MEFNKTHFTDSHLLNIYRELVLPRLIEEKQINLLRQGKISKWFSGIGQEAVSVGCAMAMDKDEYILTMHRNLGVFTARKIELNRLFAQFQGKESGYSKGRERSFHFGTREHHIMGMISHLGPQLAAADGIALWHKIKKEKQCCLVFTGEGGTSEGDFHEALNVAAVWELPVIFVIENNGYGLSTPVNEQYKCKTLIDKGIGYGIEAVQIDGNNILEVYTTIKKYSGEIRKNHRPVIIEALTFRMRGHEEASGTRYIPKEYFEQWGKKDPITAYEAFLKKEKLIDDNYIEKIKTELKEFINTEWDKAESFPGIKPDTEKELADVYSPFKQKVIHPASGKKTNKRFINAISDALKQSLEKYPDLIIMGQDIAEYGGAFKITEGFVNIFGKDRIRNTPLCESAIAGAALGYSVKGGKAVVEMQFADFVSSAFTQIVNNLAKIHYRWGQDADVVIRMPSGAGVGAGPFHSQSNEAWFTHVAGLKVVYPATPYDAKGLLNAAIEDPNPVMYFEHKALYRSISEDIPDDYYTVEIGKAKKVSDGGDITIITYGMGVHWAEDVLNKNKNISADLIDLRTLMPWDKEAVEKSVKKTGKVLILHEDTLAGGIGGEISAWIAEYLFGHLDAPVIRVASLDTPVPFSTELEKNFLAKDRLEEKLKYLVSF
ncbi:MAG: dehydrogenase E1 component subunit alpha/beta [Ignavibacteriaceae bacterium]